MITLQWIIGISLAVLGVYVTYRYRRRRLIRYVFGFRRRIFSNLFGSEQTYDFRLNDRPVRDIFLIQLSITNRGTEPLEGKDFIRPLTLRFDRRVHLFLLDVKRRQSDIPFTHQVGEENDCTVLRFKTDLFETGDTIWCKFIYESDAHAEYDLDGRIVDGKIRRRAYAYERIDEDWEYAIQRKYKLRRDWVYYLGLAGLGVILLIVALVMKVLPTDLGPLQRIPAIVIVLALSVPTWWVVMRNIMRRVDHGEERALEEGRAILARRRARLSGGNPADPDWP